MAIADNVAAVEAAIEKNKALANRQDQVTLVGVTKYHTVAEAQQVVAAGVKNVAENRPEGLAEKQAAFADHPDLIWHFIGTLQRRKVKQVINEIDYFHALDRLSLAKEIQKRALKPIKCFVEVNVSGEESKSGLQLADVAPFIQSLAEFDRIQVVGLMTMAPIDADATALHGYFKSLRLKRDEIKALNLAWAPCQELSMGMTHDYEIAVQEGATFVRVGTRLFEA